jgi:hypothetical protein
LPVISWVSVKVLSRTISFIEISSRGLVLRPTDPAARPLHRRRSIEQEIVHASSRGVPRMPPHLGRPSPQPGTLWQRSRHGYRVDPAAVIRSASQPRLVWKIFGSPQSVTV